jgi:D-alanyl-D-alanine carboxypeptidase/D-alanyl-D-alanine-endopeptidase (penicillin-binding protein 4)
VVAALGGVVTAQAPPTNSLHESIDTLLSVPALEHVSWGIVARSLANNETLYSLNARKLLTPASNMKIVTLAAAADKLGWDFSFETRLLAAGPIAGGVLDGDLVVVGTGDPSIDDWDGAATRLFQSWAVQLKGLGIRAMSGRLVGDDNAFDDESLGGGWAWDDLGASFATGVGALQFNENTAQVGLAPGSKIGNRASVTVGPPGTALAIRNLVTTSHADEPIDITIRRVPGSAALEILGSVPLGSSRIVRNVSVDNPTVYFVNALRANLIANGIDVRGPAVDIDDIANAPSRDRATLLISHRSPPLAELAQTMMRLSQNLYAETLLKTLGAAEGPGTVEAGRRVVASMLQDWGVGPTDLVMEDGSGLSRYNLATPDAIVAILSHISRDDRLRGPFEATLPVAGRDGTLAQRLKGTPAEGNARVKSGSFSNGRALSGYVRTADGEVVAFSIIANNFGVPADIVDRTLEAIIVEFATFKR